MLLDSRVFRLDLDDSFGLLMIMTLTLGSEQKQQQQNSELQLDIKPLSGGVGGWKENIGYGPDSLKALAYVSMF